jgi:hypothetical protein
MKRFPNGWNLHRLATRVPDQKPETTTNSPLILFAEICMHACMSSKAQQEEPRKYVMRLSTTVCEETRKRHEP